MRRLLQRLDNGLYYQGLGVWTNNPDQAFAFHKTSGAIDCCVRENLPPVQLVMKFEDSAFDVRVPCWTAEGLVGSDWVQLEKAQADYLKDHAPAKLRPAALAAAHRHSRHEP